MEDIHNTIREISFTGNNKVDSTRRERNSALQQTTTEIRNIISKNGLVISPVQIHEALGSSMIQKGIG